MSQRRKWFAAVACLTLAALLPSGPAGAAPAGQVELDFWVSFGGASAAVLNEALQDFHQMYPHIKVTVTPASSGEKLFLAIASGSPPDLAMMHGGEYSVLGMQGNLEPLDPLIEAYAGFTFDDLAPGYDLLGIYDGVRYALPFWDTAPSYALLYNTAMWDATGLPRLSRNAAPTWEEVAEFHRKLTVITGDGQVVQVGFHPKEGWHRQSYTIETLWDAPLYEANYRPKIDTPELTYALTKLKEYFVDPTPEILNINPSFLSRTTAMYVHGPTLIGNRAAPLGGDLDVAWAPHITGTKAQRWRAWAMGIPKGTQHLPEVMLLVTYLLTNQEAIDLMWEKGGAFTANRQYLLNKELNDTLRWYIDTLFTAEKIVVEDMSPMKNALQDAVTFAANDVLDGREPPENALAIRQREAMARWEEIYGR